MLEMNLSIQKFCMMVLSFLDFSLIENEVTRAHLQMFSDLCFDFYFLRSHFRFSCIFTNFTADFLRTAEI